jgi:co-chaperonin GroES (HSP10)
MKDTLWTQEEFEGFMGQNWSQNQIEEYKSQQLGRVGIKPTDFYLLLKLPEIVEKTTSGIYMPLQNPNDFMKDIVGRVLEFGPNAFRSKTRFPQGPTCKIGDIVMFRAQHAERNSFNGKKIGWLADISITGLIDEEALLAEDWMKGYML